MTSIAAAPTRPITNAIDVIVTLDTSNMNASRAGGIEKITTYASPDAVTSATRHHWYGRATTASTHTPETSRVISAAVDACVCSVGVASRP